MRSHLSEALGAPLALVRALLRAFTALPSPVEWGETGALVKSVKIVEADRLASRQNYQLKARPLGPLFALQLVSQISVRLSQKGFVENLRGALCSTIPHRLEVDLRLESDLLGDALEQVPKARCPLRLLGFQIRVTFPMCGRQNRLLSVEQAGHATA